MWVPVLLSRCKSCDARMFQLKRKARPKEYCESCGVGVRLYKCRNCDTTTQYNGYCSTKCNVESEGAENSCAVCGGAFIGLKDAKFCSDKCSNTNRQRIRSAQLKEWRASQPGITCAECGKSFKPRRYGGGKSVEKFCSKKCGNRSDMRKKHHRKRAAGEVTITRQELLLRDGGVCGICKGKINPQLSHPHPMSMSVDHITPVSLGGTNESINLQSAHLGCNSKKNNTGVGDQLRLA